MTETAPEVPATETAQPAPAKNSGLYDVVRRLVAVAPWTSEAERDAMTVEVNKADPDYVAPAAPDPESQATLQNNTYREQGYAFNPVTGEKL